MKTMRLFRLCIIAMLFVAAGLWAQEKEAPQYGWKNEVVGNLNFTQTSLSNWAQGGEDTWTWQIDLNGKFVNDQEKVNWANTGKVSFGKTKAGDDAAKKAADEISLESVLTYKVGAYINPYVSVSGETQMTSGFDFNTAPKTKISDFLDPGYFVESIGLGYEPVKNFKTRMGLALKQTVADDFAARYSDDPKTPGKIEKVRSEVGVESVTDFSRKLSENILFTSKLNLFSDLTRVNTVDVEWDNVFSARVSKYIAVSFNLKMFYDRDISVKRQLKQVLAVGLTYAFL